MKAWQLLLAVVSAATFWCLSVAVPECFAVAGPVAAIAVAAAAAGYALKKRSPWIAVGSVVFSAGSTVPAEKLGQMAFERRVIACDDDYAGVINAALETPDVGMSAPAPTGICLPMKWAKGMRVGEYRVVTFGPDFPTRLWLVYSSQAFDIPLGRRCVYPIGGRWYGAIPCRGKEP